MIAESLLVKQQLLILNRSRQRAPNLRAFDRILAGACALFMRPARVIRSAIVLKPSTILDFHRILRHRKYRLLFSSKRRGRSGPKGPSTELVDDYPFLPVQLLLRDRFAAIDDIRRVDCPVLVMAGDRDRVVPLDESRRLCDAMRSPKELVILGGGGTTISSCSLVTS